MTDKTAGISNGAVRKATGRTWSEWRAHLDERGAAELPHPEIARMLAKDGLSGWWSQEVAVGYEQLIGRRIEGQVAGDQFQVGVQRTLSIPVATAWSFLTSADGRALWLGETDHWSLQKGHVFIVAGGGPCELRSVAVAKRLRLIWQPPFLDHPTTLQVTFDPKGDRTAIRFHQEKLADPDERERMREHWLEVLDQIRDALTR